jgi:hypothetical protein
MDLPMDEYLFKGVSKVHLDAQNIMTGEYVNYFWRFSVSTFFHSNLTIQRVTLVIFSVEFFESPSPFPIEGEGERGINHLFQTFLIIANVDQYLFCRLHEHLQIFFDIVGVVRPH